MENKGRKHCEERQNCLLQAISTFLIMFSTAIHYIFIASKCGIVWLWVKDYKFFTLFVKKHLHMTIRTKIFLLFFDEIECRFGG